MPIFGNPSGGPVEFYDFKWEGWTWFYPTQQASSTPAPALWDVKDGCKEKFQMVPFILPPLED